MACSLPLRQEVKSLRASRVTCLVGGLSLLLASTTASAASFSGLGYLPGDSCSSAQGVSADGSVVVGWTGGCDGGLLQAFRWTATDGMVGLGGVTTDARGVSGDGSVVVGDIRYPDRTSDAFRWTASGGMDNLGSLNGHAVAMSASSDGSVIVGGSGGPFRWTASSGMVELGPNRGSANDVSDDGSVIVGSDFLSAFRWTADDGITILGPLPGDTSNHAFAVSGDGAVTVGSSYASPGREEAFRWTATDGVVGLGVLPWWYSSVAVDVSADGEIVVGYGETPFDRLEAILWDPTNGLRSMDEALSNLGLDLTGWTLTEARAISADGKVVVGVGRNPSGYLEGWMASSDFWPVPEPSTALLVLAGMVGVAPRRSN